MPTNRLKLCMLSGSFEYDSETSLAIFQHRGGRIFYTSLGHQQDFEVEMFLRLLANAVLWTGGRLDAI